MKLISKIHLVYWHYIKYRTLEINPGINFFTGKTGAGKSTVIDALQLVILGDVKGTYFNKAANEGSKRTLIEYLRGMIKDDENEGKRYRRQDKDFSSYIVLEINDTTKKKKFCLGVVFNIRKDSDEPEHQFFFLDEPLPKNGFIVNKTPLDIKSLKEEYGDRIKNYSTEEYKDKFLFYHMGKLKKDFFTTFKKSVSFKPPKNIREFINDFICEEVHIDIDEMKERIRSYRHLEREMQTTKEQIGYLKDIQNKFNEWSSIENQKKISRFIIRRCEVESIDYEVLKLINNVSDAEAFVINQQEKLEDITEEINSFVKKKKEIEYNIDHSEENEIREKMDEIEEKIKDLKVIERHYKTKSIEFSKWLDCIQDWDKMFEDDRINDVQITTEISKMKEYALNEDSFLNLNISVKQKLEKIQEEYYSNSSYESRLKDEIKNLKIENQQLGRGIKKYPDYIEKVRQKVSEGLYSKYNYEVKVEVLADLIDVKDKSWKNAIEAYMNTQKLYLLVESQYYEDALSIYINLDKDKYYAAGVIDVEKISRLNKIIKINSLAEEIYTDNNYAKIYTDFLLGNVIKCENKNEIRNYHTAITKECFLYKGFIAKRLRPDTYKENSYIGKDSNIARIQHNKERIMINEKLLLKMEEKGALLLKYKNLKVFTDQDIVEIIENQNKIITIPEIENEFKYYQDKLSKINLLYVIELKNELISVEASMEIKIKDKETIQRNLWDKRNYINITLELIPNREKDKLEKESKLIVDFKEIWINDIGEKQFDELLKHNNISSLKKKYEGLLENELEPKSAKEFKDLGNIRGKFLEKYVLFWDKNDILNNRYENLLKELEESELTKYESKIEIQKQRAYAEFKEDLLYKLRDGIIKTEEQLKFLNKSIQHIRFGNKKYEFKVRGSKKYYEYYQMLKDDLLIMPNSIFSANYEKKYYQQLQDLFSLIADSGDKNLSLSELEQVKNNIKKYTDYRTYLDFDMIEDTNGITSDLSKTMLKTSGGETQSPFYIAVLASFIQAYRMDKNDSETMRLIVFDEAFSKMDEEHIEISVKLMRELGFQAIIAAPDDKIKVIGPHTDKIFVVENTNKENISICDFEKEERERLLE